MSQAVGIKNEVYFYTQIGIWVYWHTEDGDFILCHSWTPLLAQGNDMVYPEGWGYGSFCFPNDIGYGDWKRIREVLAYLVRIHKEAGDRSHYVRKLFVEADNKHLCKIFGFRPVDDRDNILLEDEDTHLWIFDP